MESKLSTLSFDAENKIGKCLETNNNFEQSLELLTKKQESDLKVMEKHLSAAQSKYKLVEKNLINLNKKYI